MSVIDPRERAKAHAETQQVDFYAEALKASEQFRQEYQGRMNVVKGSEMPFERSPNGLIKHINEKMNTKECCLTSTCSSCRRQSVRQAPASFGGSVLRGRGARATTCLGREVRLQGDGFEWDEEPKRFEWEQGDFVSSRPTVTNTSTPIQQRSPHHRDQQPDHQADGL
jgi:hypothetical protein